jgi:predicted phosphodiesterase
MPPVRGRGHSPFRCLTPGIASGYTYPCMDTTAATEPVETKKPAPARPARPRLRLIGYGVVCALLALLGAAAAVTLFGAQTYHWRAFDLEVAVRPALSGETRLIFAPLGEVRARTHDTPLSLDVRLGGIGFDEMKRLILKPPPRDTLERDFEETASRCLRAFSLRQIGLGALGALLVPLFLHARRLRWWLLCAVWGGSFIAASLWLTFRDFDRKAFENPTYTGSLREAHWIISLVKDAFNKAETLSDKLKRVADNLDTLYGRINAVPGLAADVDTINILHISDIHNNPAAVRFVRELVAKVRVDAVIDTGDLTDFGSPLETQLSRYTARMGAPYLFVAGNHDSQDTVDALRAAPNTVILDYNPVTVAGLSVLGAPDPSSSRHGPGNVDTSPEALREAANRLADAFRHAPVTPDIVAVHNPRQAEALIGQARLILCGHVHRIYVDTDRNTILCNAGTTGAAGARYFDRKEGVPFSAAILSFSRQAPPRLLFIDQVVLDGSLGQYSITRRTFNSLPSLPAGQETDRTR